MSRKAVVVQDEASAQAWFRTCGNQDERVSSQAVDAYTYGWQHR
jgi:hypothetical protein